VSRYTEQPTDATQLFVANMHAELQNLQCENDIWGVARWKLPPVWRFRARFAAMIIT
jgi:hypothetical protein